MRTDADASIKNTKFKSIETVLDNLQKKIKTPKINWLDLIKLKWSNLVGEFISKNVQPVKIINNILYLEVKTPIWKQEINSGLNLEISSKLKELTHNAITDIKVELNV